MGTLRSDLAAGADEVRETHISWVFLGQGEVYKVKKPVTLPFLDFASLAAREAACEAEVRLNRRLAPDVYRGVVPVRRDREGRHRIGGEGQIVDYAVRMRRLADHDRADARLARGELTVADLARIAAPIARFHAGARCDAETSRFGRPEAIAVNVRENFAETRGVLETLLTPHEARELERWQHELLERCEDRLHARIERGRIRDGHGDLRLEHVYLEGERVLIIDCIEFNDRFRYADVCADLAFLSMDLAWHGRLDLAERALATYAQATSDYDLYPLVDFYESYRATVRGKVSMLLAVDEDAPLPLRERARDDARRYFRLALAAEQRPMVAPRVVAIGGVIASGKSTLADRLGLAMGAPAINTDRIRKHLLGARPTEKLYEGAFAGAYDPAFTEAVYAEVGRAAEAVIASGRSVILDASFRTRAMRAEARALAARRNVAFLFLECRCDPELSRARLREREGRESVSDGRLAIFDDFLREWEPVSELSAEEHLVVDTGRPIEEVLDALSGRLPMWPVTSSA